MPPGKKRPPATTPASDDAPFEFRIGRPEFRIGVPESERDNLVEAFRIGEPPSAEETGFVIGGPRTAKAPRPDEFVIGGPRAAKSPRPGGFVIGDPQYRHSIPPLPLGWEPVPRQPEWSLTETPAGPEISRVDRPRPRYRGLKPLKTTLPEDLAEEILDMLVYRAARGEPAARSLAEFIRTAVERTLAINRALDGFEGRYPEYTVQGIATKRGRRPGSKVGDSAPTRGRDIVFRAPMALVEEVHDFIIHRNGGTPDGPATVSAFISHAACAALAQARRKDRTELRYPPTSASVRARYLDARAVTPSPVRS